LKDYLTLLKFVLEQGAEREDRTGTGTLATFGNRLEFDLSKGLPIVTTKKIHLHSVIHELLWFLSGDSNVKTLQQKGVTIWDEWADSNGDLGPVYGKQWRKWETTNDRDEKIEIDQIKNLIETLRTDPYSRRHIVSTWNVGDLNKMALAPCHILFQFYAQNNYLSCQIYQRSADIFLGLPFNIASYALLTHMVAHQTKMTPSKLIWVGGDCHLYKNHIEQARLQLNRKPYKLPTLSFRRNVKDIFSYVFNDFDITNYKHHELIRAPIAI
tara:strand:- start:408 stop:1214 length:807 start_codon:yes stop_codon:yes gene_type:complete